jgi:small subunit ribosomal protein S20
LANHKSALKRARQNEKKQLINKARKSRIKNIIKNVENSLKNGSETEIMNNFVLAQKIIQKISAKGVVHKNAASRKISRLHLKIKAATQKEA